MKILSIIFLLTTTHILCMDRPLRSILKKNKSTTQVFVHADCVKNAVQSALIMGDTKSLRTILARGACAQNVYNLQLVAVMEVAYNWSLEGSVVPENVKKTVQVMKKFSPRKIKI